MKRNEKILAGVLGLFLAGYLFRGPIEAATTGPIDDLQATLNARLQKAGDLSDQTNLILAASSRVGAARGRSLPADVSYAQRLYPQWLGDVANLSGFDDVRAELQAVQPRRGEKFRPVRVELKALARLDELDDFLRRLRETDLLHRVNRVKVYSPSEEGDVDLEVTVLCEALSLPTAAERDEIFPVARLTAPLPADGTTAQVTVPAGLDGAFPKTPGFLVRAGTEFLRVETIEPGEPAADGEPAPAVWTVARGAEGTDPAEQPEGAFLQLWPRIEPDGELLAFSETGPFRKPRTYAPKFNLTGPTRLVRGDAFEFAAPALDFDPRGGDPIYAAENLPAGATLDAKTGRLAWEPPDDLPAGDYPVTLKATIPKPDTTLEEEVTLTLAERNTPPTISSVEPQTVNAGDVLLFRAEAADAEESDAGVVFSLKDPPEGAAVDAATGAVRWEVPATFDPGESTLTVVAADRGEPPLTGETAVTVTVTEDLRPFVRFVGSQNRGGKTAWFFNQAEGTNTYLRVDEEFELVGVAGTVREIARDSIEYDRAGRRWRVRLGEFLSDAKDLGEAPAAERSSEPSPPPDDADEAEAPEVADAGAENPADDPAGPVAGEGAGDEETAGGAAGD